MNRRTEGGRHAAPSGDRAAAVTGALVFVLTPWLSLGYGTPIVFLVAAVLFGHLGRPHTVVLWTDDRYPTVAFTTANGASVRAETGDFYWFTHRDDYAVGRATTVHYDPAHPADVRLHTGLDSYDLLAIGYLVAGAAFTLRWLIRRRRAARSVPAGPALP